MLCDKWVKGVCNSWGSVKDDVINYVRWLEGCCCDWPGVGFRMIISVYNYVGRVE